MLNKNEKIVMQIIYDKMSNLKKSVILTEGDIFAKIPKKAKIENNLQCLFCSELLQRQCTPQQRHPKLLPGEQHSVSSHRGFELCL